MKRFLAIYTGSPSSKAISKWNELDGKTQKEREDAGMKAWMAWGATYSKSIIENGAPLGKTKRIDPHGISDIKNNMTGYVIVEAESHEEAARMFLNHPHFAIFPGDGVEIMECLPLPKM